MGFRDIFSWVNGSENFREKFWEIRIFGYERNKDKVNGYDLGRLVWCGG